MSVTTIRLPDQVAQKDIDDVILLINLAEEFALKRDNAVQRMTDRLVAGATVEDGAHTARLKRTFQDGKLMIELFVR